MTSEEYKELKEMYDDLKSLLEERTSFTASEVAELKQEVGL